MAELERELQEWQNSVVEESDKKGLTTRKQKIWLSSRVKAQDASYELEIKTSIRWRSLNIWEAF